MTCDQLSVHSWLRDLRITTENYDPGVPVNDFVDETSEFAEKTSDRPKLTKSVVERTNDVDEETSGGVEEANGDVEETNEDAKETNEDAEETNDAEETKDGVEETNDGTEETNSDAEETKEGAEETNDGVEETNDGGDETNAEKINDAHIKTNDTGHNINITTVIEKGKVIAENSETAIHVTPKASDVSGKTNRKKTKSFGEKPSSVVRRISETVSEYDPNMASESENLKRLSVLSGSYEDIWNCRTEFRDDAELKHGHVCRVSFEFDEMVQELCIKPVILAKFDFSIPTDILQWKSELLFDYSSEDEENQEYVSLEKINEEKGQTCYNQTRPFPTEHIVEIRQNSATVRRGDNRSQTLHEFAFGNVDQQLENYVEIPIDIRGVTKLLYGNGTRKLTKNHILRICRGQMFLVSDKGEEEVIINQLRQASYKSVSKKEIAITQTTEDACKTYKLQFDSTKDLNVATVDLGRYYASDRSSNQYQTNGEEKSQIKYKLLKLLGKRSSKDLLEKKGIIRNEPIFGNTLKHLYEMDKQEVPEFVIRIIQFIELPKNIKSIGLYRASGNLATIQKIRFFIDKNNLKILDDFKYDVDVLTGSLKLFFRELKEPLIPHKTYEELCRYIDTDVNAKAEEQIQHLVNKIDKPHRKTLLTLLEHLLKVESHCEDNRMDAYNISIVWGPTLIWPPDNCHENILLSHTNANKVIELLLNVYKKTFNPRKNESSPKISYKEESKDEAARGNLLHNKNALMLELNENLTHSLRRAGSKDNLLKSTDNVTKLKDDHPKTPDKEAKFNLDLLCTNSKEKIPEFLTRTIPLIEKGINSELLYKRCGSNDKLEKIRKKIAKSRSNLSSMEKYNVHELAWALKNFFAELHEPLIPKEIFERLVLATEERIERTKLRNIKAELSNANIPHRETLDYLLKHLVNVSLHEEANKMSKHNIATEWAPFLLRSFVEDHEISACVHVLETLLQVYDARTVINMVPERDFKHNTEIHSSENRLGRSPDKGDDGHANMAQLLGQSPDKYEKNSGYPPPLKRKPRIAKNDSSLYRASRFITNTLSLYDNVQPYVESVKDEATFLEGGSLKNSHGKSMEHRTKL